MDTRDAYNRWAKSYDNVYNKTRDLELKAFSRVLDGIECNHILEIGCGTGKNTQWLAPNCEKLTAIDFSEEMLIQARKKISDPKVSFTLADITIPWEAQPADLITCSLVLEHIEHLDFIFAQAANILKPGGRFYICELHPYKQLQGSRARFEESGEVFQLEYFIHHISDYMSAAFRNGFTCQSLLEWFDSEDTPQIPRLISFLFNKS